MVQPQKVCVCVRERDTERERERERESGGSLGIERKREQGSLRIESGKHGYPLFYFTFL